MWMRVMLLTGTASTIVFFACGLFATVIHLTGPKSSRSPRWTLALLVAPILGALNTFLLAAIPSFLIAAVYENLGISMSQVAALGWGLGQGLFISLINAGAFQRIV